MLTSKRKQDRQIRDKESATLAAIVPRQILGDSTASVTSYMKEQYLDRPKECGKEKSHSPYKSKFTWDVSTAMDLLRAWPEDTQINWSSEAEKLGIPTGCQQGPGFEGNCPKTWYRHHVFGWKNRQTHPCQETEAAWQ